jgi:hypothetical protein
VSTRGGEVLNLFLADLKKKKLVSGVFYNGVVTSGIVNVPWSCFFEGVSF